MISADSGTHRPVNLTALQVRVYQEHSPLLPGEMVRWLTVTSTAVLREWLNISPEKTRHKRLLNYYPWVCYYDASPIAYFKE